MDAQPIAQTARPKFIATQGRGGKGKSTFLRVVAERAQLSGTDIAIADADRQNATLAAFFSDVVRPEHDDERSVADWLDGLLNSQAETRLSVLLDMGAGDKVFPRVAHGLELADLLDEEGIMPVAVHCIGTDIDDLNPLRDVEAGKAFCPPQTILVLNEGLIPDQRPVDAAFADVRKHKIYRAALDRGAREIVLPKLECMQEINNRRLLFADAEKTLGMTNRRRVWIWRRRVGEALAPVADWLP